MIDRWPIFTETHHDIDRRGPGRRVPRRARGQRRGLRARRLRDAGHGPPRPRPVAAARARRVRLRPPRGLPDLARSHRPLRSLPGPRHRHRGGRRGREARRRRARRRLDRGRGHHRPPARRGLRVLPAAGERAAVHGLHRGRAREGREALALGGAHPTGQILEWEAEIIEDRPGELIAWRSRPRPPRAPRGRGPLPSRARWPRHRGPPRRRVRPARGGDWPLDRASVRVGDGVHGL